MARSWPWMKTAESWSGLAPRRAPPHQQQSQRQPAPRHTSPWPTRPNISPTRFSLPVVHSKVNASRELIADLDPEEARRLLDPALQIMMDAVHRYEGTVNQILGDGIMALFGAPLAL